jgi:maltose alpha-D-glucosyltransferase/alpha-amylase
VRIAGVDPGGRSWIRAATDQSNSLVFLENRYVLKVFRRVEPGPNPELEIGSLLTEAGFARVPALGAALLYERPGHEAGTLALIQAAAANQGSGWSFTLDELQRYYEHVAARISGEGTVAPMETDEPPPFFAALENWYLTAASTLGRRTADLHLALARGSGPAFAPEPLDQRALDDLASGAIAHANIVFDLLASQRDTLPDSCRRDVETVLASRASLVDGLAAMRAVRSGGLRTRVHGDYHLGQVLRAEEDFVILDFEGEPGRSLAERRAKTSPLKDVAGMIRSFNYAAHAALIALEPTSPIGSDVLMPWAASWQHWVCRAFLDTYRETMADSAVLPSRDGGFDLLLNGFILDKALYELAYELNNRPGWARIPLHALVTLALRLHG